MQQPERKIIWQKWVNPLTGAGGPEDPDTSSLDEEQSVWKDSVESQIDTIRELHQPDIYKPKLGKLIASPLGFIPLTEHGDPAVVYDFWVAHTNFDITKKVQNDASMVEGVESWDTFSRYRARVGFGKAFKSAEVKRAIQKLLGCAEKKVTVPPRVVTIERLQKKLASTSQAWAILELPDGQLQTFTGAETEVREYVENHNTLNVFTSWDRV